jgi:hypothetical protein
MPVVLLKTASVTIFKCLPVCCAIFDKDEGNQLCNIVLENTNKTGYESIFLQKEFKGRHTSPSPPWKQFQTIIICSGMSPMDTVVV